MRCWRRATAARWRPLSPAPGASVVTDVAAPRLRALACPLQTASRSASTAHSTGRSARLRGPPTIVRIAFLLVLRAEPAGRGRPAADGRRCRQASAGLLEEREEGGRPPEGRLGAKRPHQGGRPDGENDA